MLRGLGEHREHGRHGGQRAHDVRELVRRAHELAKAVARHVDGVVNLDAGVEQRFEQRRRRAASRRAGPRRTSGPADRRERAFRSRAAAPRRRRRASERPLAWMPVAGANRITSPALTREPSRSSRSFATKPVAEPPSTSTFGSIMPVSTCVSPPPHAQCASVQAAVQPVTRSAHALLVRKPLAAASAPVRRETERPRADGREVVQDGRDGVLADRVVEGPLRVASAPRRPPGSSCRALR